MSPSRSEIRTVKSKRLKNNTTKELKKIHILPKKSRNKLKGVSLVQRTKRGFTETLLKDLSSQRSAR
jgi:hypothetical protein